MKRIGLVLILLCSVLPLVQTYPAKAQFDQQCEAQNFPADYTITHGQTSPDIPDAVYSIPGIDPNGSTSQIIQLTQSFTPKLYGTFLVDYFFPGSGDANPIVLDVTLYRNGNAVGNRQFKYFPILNISWVTNITVAFSNIEADQAVIWLYHRSDGTFGGRQLGIRVTQACSYNVVTPTPSATIQLETDTPSPAPSTTPSPLPTNITPSATLTASATLTPTPTITPGGPTLTALPSVTSSLTATAPGLAAGGNLFSTVAPPVACGDPLNPCGALPFPVPAFATISLTTPTRIASVTPAGGYVTGTPGGTTTGTTTGTPATGTSVAQGSVQDFATRMSNVATNLPYNAPINGPDGNLLDLNNSANEIGSTIGQFWGTVRGLQALFLGRAGTLVAFLILLAGFIVLLKLFLFAIKMTLNIVKWITRVMGVVRGVV